MSPKHFKVSNFQDLWIPNAPKLKKLPYFKKNTMSRKYFLFFSLIFKSSLVYAHPQIMVPTGPKSPEIMNIEVFAFSHNQIEKLVIPNEGE